MPRCAAIPGQFPRKRAQEDKNKKWCTQACRFSAERNKRYAVALWLPHTLILAGWKRGDDTLDFEFDNTYRIGVGANYKWDKQFMLKLGTAYDKSPVPDAQHRTAFLPDSDRWWLAIGGKYQASKASAIDFGYAHLFIKDADTFRNKGVGVAGAQGILSGSYEGHVDILSIQFSYSF